MDLLLNLASTLGIDRSFFIQLSLVGVLYVVVSRVLFRPYLDLLKKRESETSGSFKESSLLEKEIESLKSNYESKVQEVDKRFQEIFRTIKSECEEGFEKESLRLKEASRSRMEANRSQFAKRKNPKELPGFSDLSDLLTKKIQGS